MNQCLNCRGYLFFVPLPGDVFACCTKRGEKVWDIDLKTGLSPLLKKHGLENQSCDFFEEGTNPAQPEPNNPFKLDSEKQLGEKYLNDQLFNH